MRHQNLLIRMLLTIIVCCCSAVVWAAPKVQVCHIPPSDPSNFHTITVSENALSAHLAHGDVVGACLDNCETLCNDGDACTIDTCDPVSGQCAAQHPRVDCRDGLYCTTDSCDPLVGCLYTPVTCTRPDLCTVSTCNEGDLGACVDTPVFCGAGETCDLGNGLCTDPCSGVICEPTEQCLVSPGTCNGGDCFFDPAPDGTSCDDGDPTTVEDQCVAGNCAGAPRVCTGGDRSGFSCEQDSDCWTCADNGDSCKSDSECKSCSSNGDRCNFDIDCGGRCTTDSSFCIFDSQCPEGGTCIYFPCESIATCIDNAVCEIR